MEEEKNGELPVLDILIKRINNNNNNKLTTTVYWKETHSDRYIHYLSNHNPIIFRNTLLTMVRRAILYCTSPQALEAEISHLKNTFAENCYPDKLINSICSNLFIEKLRSKINYGSEIDRLTKTTMDNKDEKEEENTPLHLRIPYDPYIWQPLKKVCTKLKIKLGASRGCSIGQMLIQRRPKRDPLDYVGGVVYKIPCTGCSTCYIGETIQKTRLRMTQHKAQCSIALRTRKLTTSDINDCGTAKHTLDTGHQWNFKEVEVLAKVQYEKDRKLHESIEIYCHVNRGVPLANVMDGTPLVGVWHELL
jgi:hypothetical protein